jgi:septum formation protein
MTSQPSHLPPLILASASPRRRELMTQLGVIFEARAMDINEDALPGETPTETQKRITLAKAMAVNLRGQGHPAGAIVIACDTTVLLDGEMLNKPADADQAREMLRRLRGRAHQVQSCIVVRRPERTDLDIVVSDVYMRDYGDDEIERYIESGDPFDKAGSYAVQHIVFHPVARICGCPLNVVGLSLCQLRTHVPELPPCGAVCAAWFGLQCPVEMSKVALTGHCVAGPGQP